MSMEDDVDDVIGGLKHGFFTTLRLLHDLNQDTTIKMLMADVFGTYLSQLLPYERGKFRAFLFFIADALGDIIFEDAEDVDSFLQNKFSEEGIE